MNEENRGRKGAAAAHALGFLTGFIAPLVFYLALRRENFMRQQVREALNFQLTILPATLLGSVLNWQVGLPLVLATHTMNLALCGAGTIKAARGEAYRYPVCIRFLKAPGPGG